MKNLDWRNPLDVQPILGVDIVVARQDEAIALLDEKYRSGMQTPVAFANANLLNVARRDPDLRRAFKSFVVFNDGLGTDIASKLIHGRPFPENLNGTDFLPAFLGRTAHSFRVFIFGGLPGVAQRSASNLARRYPRHRFVGFHSGYGWEDDDGSVVRKIRDAKADVVLVGLGVPKQENWLLRYLDATECRLGFAVGAFIDFSAGRIPRAPDSVRHMRLEWLFRLALEPRRLFKRYVIEGAAFLLAVQRSKHQQIRSAG